MYMNCGILSALHGFTHVPFNLSLKSINHLSSRREEALRAIDLAEKTRDIVRRVLGDQGITLSGPGAV